MYYSEAGTPAVDIGEVSDDLLHVLELCRHKLGSSQSLGTTMLTGDVLKCQADALPHNLLSAVLQLVSQLGDSQGDRGYVLLAAVLFRSYELHQISYILNELTGLLQALGRDTVTRDYESELLQTLTSD